MPNYNELLKTVTDSLAKFIAPSPKPTGPEIKTNENKITQQNSAATTVKR